MQSTILFINAFYCEIVCFSATRGAAKWFPDKEFIDQFGGAVMYPDEVTSKWKVPPYNSKKI